MHERLRRFAQCRLDFDAPRFPLSLLFHDHRSLPVPVRGYHLQILLTVPWLPCPSSLPSLFPLSIFPPSPPRRPQMILKKYFTRVAR